MRARALHKVGGGFVAALVALALSAPVASAAPPTNDEFATAEALSGTLPTSATGTNVEATKESGEPDHAGVSAGHSVWYSWQAPSSGLVTVGTCGSNFETVLGVYTGNAVNTLTKVADGSFSRGPKCSFSAQSEVTFRAIEGTMYRIAVDGATYEEEEFEPDTEGSVKLAIALTAPPPNDAFASAGALSGEFPNVEAENWGATKEAGEPNHAGNKGGASTWYSWTAPRGGVVRGVVCATFESLFGIYAGAVNALSSVTSATTSEFECSEISFVAGAGTTYKLAVDGAFSPALESGQMGSYFIELLMPPPNDNFANAQPLPRQTSVLFSQSTVGATRQVGDPRPSGVVEGGASVWFNWTAPGAGTVSLDTCGSDFDSFLSVYTGSSLGALSPVATNDNSPGPNCPRTNRSELTFAASAGTTYRFMVGGVEFEQGNLTLRLSEALSAAPLGPLPTRKPRTLAGKKIIVAKARKATFLFHSDRPGAKFRCKLDHRAYAPCRSPKTYRNLKPGEHTFRVVAVDAAGVDPTPVISHFRIPKPSRPRR
jgi:hypothetical protein